MKRRETGYLGEGNEKIQELRNEQKKCCFGIMANNSNSGEGDSGPVTIGVPHPTRAWIPIMCYIKPNILHLIVLVVFE